MNLLEYSTIYNSIKETLNSGSSTSKRRVNFEFFLAFFLDVSIGVFILNFLNETIISEIHLEFWKNADKLAQYLDKTITWLLNNPGGLKLNSPVNTTLASFFRYHIYLWTTFVNFLRHQEFTSYLIYTVIFGTSFMLSVLADFSKIFFLHFVCFDAYATKLFEISYLTTCRLWGLVRGKKWNPLRKRTDSITFDSRQQFLSTSLFVILIFILPTFFIFFIVFRVLKLCINLFTKLIILSSLWPYIFLNFLCKLPTEIKRIFQF